MANLKLFPIKCESNLNFEVITSRVKNISEVNLNIEESDFTLVPYHDSGRCQYDAAGIIDNFQNAENNDKNLILTSVDLFIPIFTYLFGLAQFERSNSVVSTFRLNNEFYGLPIDQIKLETRIIKEIVHEYGHTMGLRHCLDYFCVMYSAVTIDDLDLKGEEFCDECKLKLNSLKQ